MGPGPEPAVPAPRPPWDPRLPWAPRHLWLPHSQRKALLAFRDGAASGTHICCSPTYLAPPAWAGHPNNTALLKKPVSECPLTRVVQPCCPGLPAVLSPAVLLLWDSAPPQRLGTWQN